MMLHMKFANKIALLFEAVLDAGRHTAHILINSLRVWSGIRYCA